MSITSSSKPEKFQYKIYPSMYGKDSWYIYRIDEEGSYDLIGPYMNEEEAEILSTTTHNNTHNQRVREREWTHDMV